jgi:hypothetical protein
VNLNATRHGAIWPQPGALEANTTFSWGFTVVYNPADKLFHAAVNVGCCGLPTAAVPPSTCSVTVGGTFLAHVASRFPDRGFEVAGIFFGPTAFNPHLLLTANGTFILYFRVNDMDTYPTCLGDGSPRASSASLVTYIDRKDITHTDPSGEGPGANMYVAHATSITGPWKASKVEITGMGRLHISNPSIALLDSGKVMLAYRFNPSHGEQNGFAMANTFLGPFKSTANLTKADGNDEDPFLWQQKADRSLHILYHNGAHGLHAFSADGVAWHKSPTHSDAFQLDISLSDGDTARLARRERPEILFADDGTPRFLYNGANTRNAELPGAAADLAQGLTGLHHGGFGHAFSLVQPIKTS